jgi:hypothetical protein
MPKNDGKNKRSGKARYPRAGAVNVQQPRVVYDRMRKGKIDSMSSHAGKAMCKQLLGVTDHGDTVYVPSDLTATREQVLADITGGTSLEMEHLATIDASTANACALLTIACNSTGYNNSTDLATTGSTYASTSAPTANPTVGVTFGSSTPLSLVAMPTARGSLNAHVFSQTVTLEQNSASAMNRAGILYVGWMKSPADITLANMQTYPGVQAYDLAQVEDSHYPIVARPPWALTVNDDIVGEAVNYGATKGGVLFMAAYGLPSGSQLAFKIRTKVFYYGEKIGADAYPIFSTMAFDCALTCWLRMFGRSASYAKSARSKVAQRLDSHAGVHTLAHTAQPLVKSAWQTAKDLGWRGLKWIGKEVSKFLPEVAALL